MRLPRVPWIAMVTTALVLVTAPFRVAPIRDSATLGAVEEASLTHSPGYLAGAPFFDALDTLSLLTVGQHVALLLTAFAAYAAWRIVHRRRKAASGAGSAARVSRHPALREVAFAPLLLLALLALYAVNAVVRRPMAALELRDLDVIAVDVHSHTKYSHDGRSRWDAEDVREWHASSGFNAAYVTDHRNYRGAEEGVANNPAAAGQGTVLLSGLEVVYRGERVNVLSAGRVYRGLTTPNLWDIDTTALAMASLVTRREPVIVQTFPGSFDRITPAQGPGTPGARAIELVDGAPRGLSQTRRERHRIVRLADSLNLALVAGSNNHGWGRTAPGWTLFRIPGWRGMAPDQLAMTLESAIREGGRRSSRVVERRVAEANHPALLALTVPLVTWRMLTTLSTDQRVMWIVWAWALALAWWWLRPRFAPWSDARGARAADRNRGDSVRER
jgi:hypothetical protein